MQSLTTHLLDRGDHGGLAFHPACPVCRQQRLAGALRVEPVLSLRTQAALAAGVVAVSPCAPAVAAAVEPDVQQEGAAAPEETGGEEAPDPDFDPGGPSTELPDEVVVLPEAEAPADPDVEEGEPLEQEPTLDTEQPPPDTTGDASIPEDDASPLDSVAPAPTAPLAPPADTPGPPPAEPPVTNPAPATPPSAQPREESERPASAKPRRRQHREPRVRRVAPVAVVPAPARAPATTAPAQTTPVAQTDANDSIRAGERFHVVEVGDSLWSIARQLLGSDATTGQVAREVERLWRRNAERIATGDPDLIMPGTKLELR